MNRPLNRVEGLCVDVSYLVRGMLENNIYIVSDDRGTMVVDPADDVDGILQALDGRTLDAIFVTHFHHDHVGALAALKKATGAPVYASAIEADDIAHPTDRGIMPVPEACDVDRPLSNGDILKVGAMEFKIIATPGHSSGSLCALLIPQFGNHADGLPILISGDTLFAGTVGRTDFEESDPAGMVKSIKKLATLPDDVVVLPGHGPLTTIGAERQRVFAMFGDEPY